jgi:hypothetical protein
LDVYANTPAYLVVHDLQVLPLLVHGSLGRLHLLPPALHLERKLDEYNGKKRKAVFSFFFF